MVIPIFSGLVGMRGRSKRMTWRRGWLLIFALTITATGPAACGRDEDGGNGTVSQNAKTATPKPTERSHEPILIRTRIIGFSGEVLPGSVISGSPFCPGGNIRHERGSPEIGFPAINVFDCPDGRLKIGFGPGPDQMNKKIQTSYWEILDGSGRFAEMSGDGQMKVRFKRAGSLKGLETFKGEVLLP